VEKLYLLGEFILSRNDHAFPWRNGPMLSWIPSEIDITMLLEN